ncbi:MAG: AI-2E family transporter [Alphaproteobacteria bacterium]|nr:AI-2E family transporter [Alphaproteobacteria bacterium]
MAAGVQTSTVLKTAAIWIGTAAAVWLVWLLRSALLVAFAALLLSLLLRLMTRVICRLLPFTRGAALVIAVLVVVGLVALCLILFGATMGGQLHDAIQRARDGLGTFEAFLRANGIDASPIAKTAGSLGAELPTVLLSGISFGEVAVIVGVSAIYLAAEPAIYRDGIATLFPQRMQKKGEEALDLIATSLKLWMLGQLGAMLIVGVLTYVGLLAIGVPAPLALALIAGLAEAVPYLGPFLGAVPALLVALTQSMQIAVWTALIYLAVHMIEGYFIAPMLQRWFVRIPPALILIGIFIAQLIFGFWGVVLAAPVVVAVFTAVKVLYVRNALHKPAEIPDTVPV